MFNPTSFEKQGQVQDKPTSLGVREESTLEEELAELKKELKNVQTENASLKSKVRILNEVIFEEQEKTFEEELKRRAEEEKSRDLEAKLSIVESELLAAQSQLQTQLISQSPPHSDPTSVTGKECSSDSEVTTTTLCNENNILTDRNKNAVKHWPS